MIAEGQEVDYLNLGGLNVGTVMTQLRDGLFKKLLCIVIAALRGEALLRLCE